MANDRCPICEQERLPDSGCACGATTVSRNRPPKGAISAVKSADPQQPAATGEDLFGLVDEDADPLLGSLVADKFRVERQVGAGGVGRVYRATQVGLQRPVALKLLQGGDVSEHSRERFQREARAASRLNHPGVAAVYDFGQWQGQLYIAMEFIEGESLFQAYQRDYPLALDRVVDLLAQTCEALAAAHARGIIHRDLKPENIMLVRDPEGQERVKLVDFGLALLVGPDAEQRLTKEGTVSGTPAYMSPEQVKGIDVDLRADLYALGVLLYEQLCVQLPFHSESATDLVLMHLYDEPLPPSERRPDREIHPEMDALVLDALSKDPTARPDSAMEFRRRLLVAAEKARSGEVDTGSRHKDALPPGGRFTRAHALGLPDRPGVVTPREDHSMPWAMVLGRPGEHTAALMDALAAGGACVSGPNTAQALLTAEEAPAYDAVVVDLSRDPDALAGLAGHLEDGLLAGVPVVALGPADSFETMARALELGLNDYVPEPELAEKLPRTLRRLMKRRSSG